ncbi:MAG TPA: methyltransferase [Planctomicrobium sp.]|nr:methyltransferase [Planctomicrobium sp.]
MDDRLLENLRNPPSERLAINACVDVHAKRILCRTVGRGQTAAFLAESLPDSKIRCHFQDVYPAADADDLTRNLPNLEIICTPDLPEDEIDLFVLPVARGGEAELTREFLQQGYDRLAVGGLLIATSDNKKDVWLHHEIDKLGKNIDRTPKRHGVTYRMKKLKPLKRMRDFTSEFVFRDGENLVQAVSRPGVFSHRRLDVGARALLEVMEIHPGDHVLDVGCGSGTVGIAAALRAPDVHVHAIDSNARAIQCAHAGAHLNGITNFTTGLTADGDLFDGDRDLTGTFDVALANPPYFSHFQIAEIFLQAARRGLKPGGRLYFVTKHQDWAVARVEQLFDNVIAQDVRGYFVITATRK